MKVQTSKLILIVDFIIAIALTIVVIVGSYLSLDMTNVTTICALWDAQLAVAVGFYYWKAKNENRSKYAMQLIKDLAERYEIEYVVHLAEVILKD